MPDPAEPYPTRSVRRIEVIEVVGLAGRGEPGDPVREVTSWWTPEGEFLAKRDPCEQQEDAPAKRWYV